MIQTAEFTHNEKTARDKKIAQMKPVKRVKVQIDSRTYIETINPPETAREIWLSKYNKSDEDRMIRGRR